MAQMGGRASAGSVADLAHRLEAAECRLAAIEAENKAAQQYAGQTRAMVMTSIVAIASLEHHVGLAKPKKRTPAAGRLPIKMVAIDTGHCESGLRKRAKRDPTFGSKVGGRWFVDPTKVTPKG